jgi:hypothetical protein
MMLKLAFILHALSPISYRLLRRFLPFPSEETLRKHFRERVEAVRENLESAKNLPERLVDWRAGNGQRIQVVVAFDAAYCTHRGLAGSGGAMAYMMLPLDLAYHPMLLQTTWSINARIRTPELTQAELRCDDLAGAGFDVVAVATDGDTGTDALQLELFGRHFKGLLCSLAEADVRVEQSSGEILGHCEGWRRVPISDPLRLFKAFRWRVIKNLIQAMLKGEMLLGLAGPQGQRDLNAEDARELLEIVPTMVDTKSTAHAQDAPALQLVNAKVLRKLLRGAYFEIALSLLPWSFIDLALRGAGLSRDDRMACLEIAYRVFAVVGPLLPKAKRGQPQPVWTKIQWVRGMNLCVVLFHVLRHMKDDEIVSLGRLGTHPVEGHFGVVRGTLRGDNDFKHWLGAEARGEMVERLLVDLGQPQLTRRTRVPISGVFVAGHEDEPTFDAAEAVCAADAFARGDCGAGKAILDLLKGPLRAATRSAPHQGSRCGLWHVARIFASGDGGVPEWGAQTSEKC